MSVKSTQTFLTFFEESNYSSFFKDLVYTGVKFEVLNPDELDTKWAQVDFVETFKEENHYIDKIDKILAKYEPKGLFSAFIDYRPRTNLEEVRFLAEGGKINELYKVVEKLFEYDQLKTLFEKANKLISENPEKEFVFGKNLLTYKDQIDTFGLKVIQEFRKNHDDQDIEESIPELDFISLGTKDVLIFQKENLDYVLGFEKSSLGDFELSGRANFLSSTVKKLKELYDSLKSQGYNPEKLSKEKYKELCILHSDLELENILFNSERFVFSVSDSNTKIKPLYAFISVSSDYLKKYETIVEKNKLATEKVDWEKEIVVWQQSQSLNPFKSVAESLGTISTKETDPSLIISFFFSLFFAFCLGDAIYGLVLSVFCGYFLFFKNLKPQFENIFRLFFISGVATIVFGALLNSWAGDLFNKTPLKSVLEGIQLINPLDPTANVPVNKYLLEIGLSPIVALLGLSVVIGLVNILSGYTIKTINEFKEKNLLGFFEELNWVFFILFSTLWIILGILGSGLSSVASVLVLISVLGFFVLNKGSGVVGKVLSGLGKIYGLISFGADILSFTRLVAVGLTGGIIATVINLLAFLIYDSIPIVGLNILGAAIVLVIGHTFNLVISLFGAYINPLRLHYVEFLPKFYDAKGRKLAVLKTEFKYLKLTN